MIQPVFPMRALSDYAAYHSSSVFIETKATKKRKKKILLHLSVWLFKILLSVYMHIL